MINVHNWEERRAHYEDYWNLRNKRPVVYLAAPLENGSYDYEEPTTEEFWFDPHWNIGANRSGYRNTYYGADAYPYVSPSLGPDLISGILGLDVTINETSAWVKHLDMSLKDYHNFSYSEDNFYLKKMEEFLTAYSQDAKQGDYIVGMVDMNTLLDGASSLVGPARLCYDLIDCPDEVLRVQNAHMELFKSIYTRFNSIVTKFQGGSTNWLSIYSDEPWYFLSNDFIVMISGEHFEQFAVSAISSMSSFIGRTLFHLDGENAIVHLDRLLKIPELTGIQVQATPEVQSAEFWIPHLKKIQAAGKTTWIEARDGKEIRSLMENLRPEGLFIKAWAGTQKEAMEIEKMMDEYYRK